MSTRDDRIARQLDAAQEAVMKLMTDEGLADVVEKMLAAHGDVLGRATRAALRSVVRRLRRSAGGPERGSTDG